MCSRSACWNLQEWLSYCNLFWPEVSVLVIFGAYVDIIFRLVITTSYVSFDYIGYTPYCSYIFWSIQPSLPCLSFCFGQLPYLTLIHFWLKIKSRIGRSKNAFTSMRAVFMSDYLTLETKLRLLWGYVFFVLLSGEESWILRQKVTDRLEAYELCLYRRFHGPKKMTKVKALQWINKTY